MCVHKTQLSLTAVTIILCLARLVIALSAHPDKATGSSSAGYRDISKQVPLRYSSVAKLNTEIESLQTSGQALGVQDVFDIVKRRMTNLKSVNIDCLTTFEGAACYQISAHNQTDDYEVYSTLFIDARTGIIEDQQAFYRPRDSLILSEDETRSVKDFHPLSVLGGYTDFEFSGLEDRKAFIVAHSAGVHEYDLLPAVATPAAIRANEIPVIVLGKKSWGSISLGDEVRRFLDAYNPATTFVLGADYLSNSSGFGQTVYFGETSIESLAAQIAERFWNDTDIVVTRDDEYRNVLIASNLASALGVPILFVEDNSVPYETRTTIDQLQPQNIYVVGEASETVIDILNDTATVVELPDYDSVVDTIAAQHEIQYLVLTNINDRTDYTRLEKASILSPILAAYHNGLIYPFEGKIEQKTIGTTSDILHEQPDGVPAGKVERQFAMLTSNPPVKENNADFILYAVNGKFANNAVPETLNRQHGGVYKDIPFYLGADRANATQYNVVLIDLDLNKKYSDSEYFMVNEPFENRFQDRFLVLAISGDGTQNATQEEYFDYQPVSWPRGTVRIGGQEYPFVLASPNSAARFEILYIDFNHDGDYCDEGEFYSIGDNIKSNGQDYMIKMEDFFQDILLVQPSPHAIKDKIRDFIHSHNLNINLMAILADYEPVPFFLTGDSIGHESDVASDCLYGDIDEDPFIDLGIGRLVGTDIFTLSSTIARSVIFPYVTNSWKDKALVFGNLGKDLIKEEAMLEQMIKQLDNKNCDVTSLVHSYTWNDSYVLNKGIVVHGGHGLRDRWSGGLRTNRDWYFNTLPLGASGGCQTAKIDGPDLTAAMSSVFMSRGGIGYLGASRISMPSAFMHQITSFFDGILYRGMTTGEAARYAHNYNAYTILRKKLQGDTYKFTKLIFLHTLLYGDPGLRYNFGPSAVAPASTDLASLGQDYALNAQYDNEYWVTPALNEADNPRYSVIFPGCLWSFTGKTYMYINEPVSNDTVFTVEQTTPVTNPLGWEDIFFVDRQLDGTANLLWQSTLVSYKTEDGSITNSTAEISYKITATSDYIIVDDFESYDYADNRIYQAWLDGTGYTEPAPGRLGNDTGSTVGNAESPFVEQTVVHGGRQSMPFDYDNTSPPYCSETWRTFVIPHDWTRNGIRSLKLWFRGFPESVGSFAEGPAGTYTMIASGEDIWNRSDQFRFAYKRLSGNGSITAKVRSITNTDVWTKVGVMIRETLDPDSKHAMTIVTPNGRVALQRRDNTAGYTRSEQKKVGTVTLPQWVRLTRNGNTFTGEYSANGSNWTPIGTPRNIAMTSDVFIGLALTSHKADAVARAEFSNITVSNSVRGQWQSCNIGMVEGGNVAGPLFVALEDSAGIIAAVTHGDPDAVLSSTWQQWDISLNRFGSAGVNLQAVKKMTIGVGNRLNPEQGGTGRLYIDDIQLYP